MTVLHLKSKTGPDGKIRLGEMTLGIPDAEVDVTVSVTSSPPITSDAAWKARMRKLLSEIGNVHVEAYPRKPMRDPWGDA